uniref:Protein-PII uridylyltransferase N-terminal domain-containing protein n=1 Tax=Branchiostoma floridae TaxID=7739 RepID=C3XX22_BRAFL|eukprot:XP_002611272.1 hypothetical protein BRAFLDRAFT_73331 [Branchiostoma floridae]
MVQAAGRFLHIDARLERSGLEDLSSVQSEYVRELQKAMAEADLSIEIEALKSLGDVFLEKGRNSGDLAEFGKAHSVYSVALTRCTHIGQVQTLLHRVKYARTFIDKTSPPNQHGGGHKPNAEVNQEQHSDLNVSPSDRLKLAETVEARVAELKEESLRSGYVNLLVESVTASDVLAEVEALKGLGDEHLRRGGVARDLADFTRASTLYSAGLARCQDADNRDALQHRVRYTARLRNEECKGKYTTYKNQATKIQYNYASDASDSDDEEFVKSDSNDEPESTYEDRYEAGVSALENGFLETAEQNFAMALRLVHGKQEEMAKEVECLYRLGDIQVAKGKGRGDGRAFSQAAALYNGALVRTEDAAVKREVNEKLKDTEASFLKHAAHTDCRPSVSDVDRGHKEEIQNMREKVRQRLESIDQQFNLQTHRGDHRAMTRLEGQRADTIKDLFVEIAQSRKEFISVLVDECMEVLDPAPCKYAVIGLGSQATETVTPYSDLEFAILLDEGCDTDENKQYFRLLTHYVHLKVINLGETIIPAMAIRSLNDFESDNPVDNWFYDSVTPRGFAFDGAMPWASKTPLGRDKTKAKPALELIRSPSSMAELQQEDVAVSEGYHLSDILRNVSCLAGDASLVKDYMEIVNETLKSTRSRGSRGAIRVGDTLVEDLERYGKQGLTAKLLDVKKDIYRFPTISIDSLCVLCGLKPGSVWKVISDMAESDILTRDNADHLKVLVSISAELRLRTYLANGKQSETMSALSPIATDGQTGDREAAFKSVFYLPDDDLLFRYHYRAMPLEKLLSSISTDQKFEPQETLQSSTLFDDSPVVKARICDQLLKIREEISHLEDALTFLLNSAEPVKEADILDYVDEKSISHGKLAGLLDKIGTAWSNLEDRQKDFAYFEQALRISKAVHGRDSVHPQIADSLLDLGQGWLGLGENREAIEYFELAYKIRVNIYGDNAVHPEIASCWGYLMKAWNSHGDFRKAADYCEQMFRIINTIHKYDPFNAAVAGCIADMGVCSSNLGDFRKAMKYRKKALKMTEAIYGNNTAHPYIAAAFKEVAKSSMQLGDYREGIYYFEQALKAWKIVLGQQTNQSVIANVLSDLGVAWASTGDYTVSRRYHQQALEMRKAICGADSVHSDIGKSLSEIGQTFTNEGRHREALKFHEEALVIFKRVHGKDSNHPDIAQSLNCLGEALCETESYERAKEIFEEALVIFKATFGDNTNNPDIAMVLNNLGIVWRFLGNNRKSITYYKQSLEIKESVYGRERQNRSIAHTYCNIAVAHSELSEYKTAIEYNEKGLDIWRNTYGSVSPFIIKTLTNIAAECEKLGETQKAIKHNEEALEMCETVFGTGKDHPMVATIRKNLGFIWNGLGNYNKALQDLESSMEMNLRLSGNQANSAVARCQVSIAIIWVNREDYSKAVEWLEKALESWTSVYGDRPHVNTAKTLAALGSCWESMRDNKQAARFYGKALDMFRAMYGKNSSNSKIASLQFCLMRIGVPPSSTPGQL